MYNFVHVYLHKFTEICSSVFKIVIFNIWKSLNRDVICLRLYICMLETAEEFVWMKMIHQKKFYGYWSNCENSEISPPQSKSNTDDIAAYVYIQTEASNRTWLFVSCLCDWQLRVCDVILTILSVYMYLKYSIILVQYLYSYMLINLISK